MMDDNDSYHKLWNDEAEYKSHEKLKKMTVAQMLAEFHETFKSYRNKVFEEEPALERLASKLIREEAQEFLDEGQPKEDILKELSDLVYVCYGYADRWGWDLNEAIRRVHKSNMSKLDPTTGEPIFREDGKILKGSNYKEPDLKDLVATKVN